MPCTIEDIPSRRYEQPYICPNARRWSPMPEVTWHPVDERPDSGNRVKRYWVHMDTGQELCVDIGWWHPPGKYNGYWTDETGYDITDMVIRWANMVLPAPPEDA